ncbi:NAD-dependent epimerase/dehydratase family protein [Pedobacter changchengzhani]|nr:NAD-dependent epimerase/dehydratase family protein [Pedobacter changchengzhani]
MKINITGANGFVGKNLSEYLTDAQFELRSITRNDLANAGCIEFKDCDAIIHLAGKAHDLKKSTNSDEYFKVNFELTKLLYDAFLKSDATKFIFISSVKASADSINEILTEAHAPNPKTAYGKSKLYAEEYIQAQTLPLGKVYYILRPCMIHGPGNKGNLNLLYKFVKMRLPYPLSAYHNKRSYLSITNLNYIIKMLLVKNVASGIYNVADDEALSTNNVVEILSKATAKKTKLLKLPKSVIEAMAKIGDVLHLPINTERLNKLTESYVVSNKLIKSKLNIDVLPINSTEGLIATAKSFK